ncbi:sulfotransferase domain-containing protein [Tamilnaduibacter salinus]|uniref:Sulfotransferase domain-containing protein n=1 Tax=Tamilnaduibacter salinus TaxID=1484056 RepID=A0A2U1CUU3_9GAMM|nr:sulfotransferase domain-containing protein [Tamilnaduibacter salinus]PVY70820.1 sulfotransferase domain-containing protein [Tamilnaduibacter salinus]
MLFSGCPNFLIPGAGKSGTTYLASILSQHPDIYIPSGKEPAYFSAWPERGNFKFGVHQYRKNFQEVSSETRIGEASTVYMYDPESPKLIREQLGDIPLIFILRNPVERIYSNYWQEIKAGKELPLFSEMIESGHPRFLEMLWVSRYGAHLERYFTYFSKENILVTFLDDLKDDPEAYVWKVLEFLQVSADVPDLGLYTRANDSGLPKSKLVARGLRNRRLLQTVRSLTPAWAYDYLGRTVRWARRVNEQSYVYPTIDAKSHRILLSELEADIRLTESILGCDLSSWRTTK